MKSLPFSNLAEAVNMVNAIEKVAKHHQLCFLSPRRQRYFLQICNFNSEGSDLTYQIFWAFKDLVVAAIGKHVVEGLQHYTNLQEQDKRAGRKPVIHRDVVVIKDMCESDNEYNTIRLMLHMGICDYELLFPWYKVRFPSLQNK